jgi:hypothetical protein
MCNFLKLKREILKNVFRQNYLTSITGQVLECLTGVYKINTCLRKSQWDDVTQNYLNCLVHIGLHSDALTFLKQPLDLNGVAMKRNSCRQKWALQYRPKQAFLCSYGPSPSGSIHNDTIASLNLLCWILRSRSSYLSLFV